MANLITLGANMQYPRTTLAFLSALALFLLGHFYSDVFHTVLVEKLLGLIAHDIFGTEKPIMLSYIDPYIVPFCILSILTFAAFNLGRIERSQTSPLQITYNPDDPQHIERMPETNSTRYHVEIFNKSYDRSIYDLTVVWDKTPFTYFVDTNVGRKLLLRDSWIAPRERRRIYLFGLDDSRILVPERKDVLDHASHFVVRARGKDTAEVTETFEYSPLRYPKLLKIS